VASTDQSAEKPRVELTFRGMVLLGVPITLVFTAANVYFGLKAGLTFASSIPATVISMAVLRAVRNATIQENNIVQTVASAAGTLSSIIFVLPGLVMIGWWKGFPYWASVGVCALGGVLGVMYSIPLRRALVTHSTLPYPEGVACAEVLKVGSGEHATTPEAVAEGKASVLTILVGSIVSAGFALIVATRVFVSDILGYFRLGGLGAGMAVTGFDLGISMALFGVGHLVGLWVGVAVLVGVFLAWGVAVPVLTWLHPAAGPAADVAGAVWSHDVRFIGAGAMGVAAIWTLVKLVGPVLSGLRSALAASAARGRGEGALLPRTEQDMPIGLVAVISAVCLLPIAWLLADFARAAGVGGIVLPLVIGGLVYVVLMGFFVSAVCGYMAGLIGSSNSPLSGVGILAVIVAALLLVAGVKSQVGPQAGQALIAFALFVTSVVFAIASIANNNLQDLKTGQLVDATPWKQQAALLVGVLAGAAIIPPVLDLLNKAYGFAGVAGVNPANALAAPQANLISALAKGVLGGQLDWTLIGIGAAGGAVIVAIDETLGLLKLPRLAPLAVGLGIYLPMSVTLMTAFGAVSGALFERLANRRPGPQAETVKRLGVLLASGFIVGESLIGILIALVVVLTKQTQPLAIVGDAFQPMAVWLTLGAFLIALIWLYRWTARLVRW
jgi:putative OPT family oligopeptide transporter